MSFINVILVLENAPLKLPKSTTETKGMFIAQRMKLSNLMPKTRTIIPDGLHPCLNGF